MSWIAWLFVGIAACAFSAHVHKKDDENET